MIYWSLFVSILSTSNGKHFVIQDWYRINMKYGKSKLSVITVGHGFFLITRWSLATVLFHVGKMMRITSFLIALGNMDLKRSEIFLGIFEMSKVGLSV
jgi:hypothetical protein